MKSILKRLDYLTQSTRGLLLMATAWDALIIALLGMLSGPMKQIITLPITLVEAERVGRIIMLYHSLAIPFVAAITYLILDMVPTSEDLARAIRRVITPGYMLVSIGGLTFAYLGHNWIFHGIFLLGQSLVFYAGVLLAVGLWPWRHPNTDPAYSHIGSLSLERVAFFVVTVTMLVSVLIGAGAGAFFGNGFEAVLAEDIVREEHNLGEKAVIAHLHIVLALIDVAIFLLVVRKSDLKGLLHKIAMPLTIIGTIIMSVGCWGVMVWEKIAHTIIYVGNSMVLLGALLMVIDGIAQLIKNRPREYGAIRALLRQPLRFGLFFQLIWLQFVMVFPGLYTAAKLDEFRAWPLEAERRILTGHWHVLATVSAVMMILLVADRLNVRGWMRQVLGWGVLLSANLAFTFTVFYEFLPPEMNRDWTVLYMDIGVGLSLIVLALFLGRRLLDLFSAKGRWTEAE
ncbi:MAG: hypothetical protein DRJ03_31495 [Chloroflexi bacterium]|nr:MAG: hypothetical protein DRI81_18165 [Chloroflexota bacterium]RLC74698.1 MAG: hypothetical protein DRJ03_31495 [Chloroflexota bacterium]